MSNYYTEVTEDIIPGHLAYAEDINLIQHKIQSALAQLITDNLGEGYVLDDTEGVFVMTPVGTDEQVDQYSHGDAITFQSMTDVYVRQTITIEKSSIQSIRVYIKNNSGANQVLHGELRTLETEDIDSDLIASYEVTVPASQTTGGYTDFDFAYHHLPEDSYYLVIKYAPGISIGYDNEGLYSKTMATSVDGVQYIQLDQDLWFEEKYATTQSYDVVKGVAVVHGEKTLSMDTHVTIPPRSGYGDRIDIVLMNNEGEYEVLQGDVSPNGKPVASDDDIPFGKLVIAYVSVPKDPYEPLLIDQEDALGHARIRRHHERLRRLEKKTEWIYNYNAPERIKYNLTGSTFYDVSESSNVEPIMAGETVTGYRLASHDVKDYYWSFKDFGGNPPIENEYEKDAGIASFVGIDHTDHTNGICKLLKRTVEANVFATWRAPGSRLAIPRGVYASDPYYWKRKHEIYRDNKKHSEYPGNNFYLSTTSHLTHINIDSRHYRNAASVKCVLYRRHGAYLATSQTWNLRNYPAGQYNIIKTEVLRFNFDITLPPGEYVWVLVVEPKYIHTKAECWIDTINYNGRPADVLSFAGHYPPNIPGGVYVNYHLAETMIFDVYTEKEVLDTTGVITSSMIDTSDGIGSVAVDINLSLPTNTLYYLDVSNDNGTTWQRMDTQYLNFPSTGGHEFIWKLTLKSNDSNSTPQLIYNANDQYAVKFSLGTVGGNPEVSGYLVTEPFCGDWILKTALPATTDKFSHWQWLRMWCTENAGTIRVDIEATEDCSCTNVTTCTCSSWTNVKSGILLEDLLHGSVDYSNYEGSYEEDEYNYLCDLDEDIILQDEIYLDRCEEAWGETEDDDYLEHTVDSTESFFKEGTKSAKVEFTTYTGATGQEKVFMSKAVDSLDLSVYDSIKLWVLTDVADGLAEGETQFCIGTSEKCATGEFHDIPVLAHDTWKQITINPTHPEALTNVVSLGLKRVAEGTEWNSESIWIDAVQGIISNLKTIDTCETAYTSDQGANVVCSASATHVTGTYSASFAVGAGATTGLLAHRAIDLDLSQYEQIRLNLRTASTHFESGDCEIVFGSNAACTEIIGSGYNLPATSVDTWEKVTFELDNPEDLDSVKSIGVRMINDRTITFLIDEIEGMKTTTHPFYQKCVRFRFNLGRTEGTDISPVIRKVGVIPIVT